MNLRSIAAAPFADGLQKTVGVRAAPPLATPASRAAAPLMQGVIFLAAGMPLRARNRITPVAAVCDALFRTTTVYPAAGIANTIPQA
jgi:hypothetical protein